MPTPVLSPQVPSVQRVRMSLVPWSTYISSSDGLGPRHIRVTYDRGEMEVMTLSPEHEYDKSLLGRLVEALTEELHIDIACFGSMTCRREELERGLEPDDSYWIASESAVRGRRTIDLDVDPPPDLTLEVEISRSTLDRMGIYAALKVPEVWRWDGLALRVALLTARGTYKISERSKAFPFLPLKEFVAFLTRADVSQTKLLRSFRVWVRKNKRAWLGDK